MNYQGIYMAVSLFSMAMLAFIMLHPRIHEGLLTKIGLIVMIVGNMGTVLQIWSGTDHFDALINSGLVLRVGLLIAALGIIVRELEKMHEQHEHMKKLGVFEDRRDDHQK